jgi:hypothetical protein
LPELLGEEMFTIEEIEQTKKELEEVFGKPKKIVMNELTYSVTKKYLVNFIPAGLLGIPIEIDDTAPSGNIYLMDSTKEKDELKFEAPLEMRDPPPKPILSPVRKFKESDESGGRDKRSFFEKIKGIFGGSGSGNPIKPSRIINHKGSTDAK